jgi:hypothetical protein
VIALISGAANVTAIVGAILVFHAPTGSGIAARFLAFDLVIAGAALMLALVRPLPTRANTPRRTTSRRQRADHRVRGVRTEAIPHRPGRGAGVRACDRARPRLRATFGVGADQLMRAASRQRSSVRVP